MRMDVIVLGAGPAGCAVSIECARVGLTVRLIDPCTTLCRLPGETLHPAGETMFRALGILDEMERENFLRHSGYWSGPSGHQVWQPYSTDPRANWCCYQALRPEFDQILHSRAQRAGVILDRESRPVNVIREGSRVVGLITNREEHRSKFVVDATGRSAWLAAKSDLRVVSASPQLIARYGWVEKPTAAEQPRFCIESGAYRWTAPVKPGLVAWTRLDLSNCKHPGQAKDVTWKVTLPSAGPGYFLVGDAGFTLDPAFSRGVLKALMSGMVAAKAIADILRGVKDEVSQTRGYTRWMRDWFYADASTLLDMYSRFECPPAWIASSREILRSIRNRPC